VSASLAWRETVSTVPAQLAFVMGVNVRDPLLQVPILFERIGIFKKMKK
jgi:hypothetical protein